MNKKIKEIDEHELTLLPPSLQMPFPKKHAWIVWVLSKENQIEELCVYMAYRPYKRAEIAENIAERRISYLDMGNSYSDWSDWTLEDVLLGIFKYPVKNQEVLWEIYRELGKVGEWRAKLAPFNGDYWAGEVGADYNEDAGSYYDSY